MTTTGWIIVAVVVVALAIIGFFVWRSRRSHTIQDRYGSEYQRAVEHAGSRSKAESELREREARVAKLPLTELTAEQRARFTEAWTALQTEFVDEPQAAVVHADVLLGDVMKARGYPVGDFEQRAADISVDHPVVVENYRAAHEIAMHHGTGTGTTEDLRKAMLHYRTLFEELVKDGDTSGSAATEAVRPA